MAALPGPFKNSIKGSCVNTFATQEPINYHQASLSRSRLQSFSQAIIKSKHQGLTAILSYVILVTKNPILEQKVIFWHKGYRKWTNWLTVNKLKEVLPWGTHPQRWDTGERTEVRRAEAIALCSGSIETKQLESFRNLYITGFFLETQTAQKKKKNPNLYSEEQDLRESHLKTRELRLSEGEIGDRELGTSGETSDWKDFLEGRRANEMVRAETLDRRRGEADIFLSWFWAAPLCALKLLARAARRSHLFEKSKLPLLQSAAPKSALERRLLYNPSFAWNAESALDLEKSAIHCNALRLRSFKFFELMKCMICNLVLAPFIHFFDWARPSIPPKKLSVIPVQIIWKLLNFINSILSHG